MNIKLDMPLGKYRELTKEEFINLSELINDSIKTFDPNPINLRRNRS